jgi:hypothetical protein
MSLNRRVYEPEFHRKVGQDAAGSREAGVDSFARGMRADGADGPRLTREACWEGSHWPEGSAAGGRCATGGSSGGLRWVAGGGRLVDQAGSVGVGFGGHGYMF